MTFDADMKREIIVLRVVGTLAVVMALLGFCYNAMGLPAFLRNLEHEPDIPFFVPAFLCMSAICVTCYVLLLMIGIQFVKGQTARLDIFTRLMIFEVIYFFSVGFGWSLPLVGRSIAAATGVAGGGMMFQAYLLFPFWAPFVVRWAHNHDTRNASNKRIHKSGFARM